jgi:hypothetical protein
MRFSLLDAAFRCVLILVVPGVVFAAPPAATRPDIKPATEAKSSAQARMRAYIDPETGRLTSTPVTAEQKRAAQQQVKESAPTVQTIHHTDGSIEDVLNGSADAVLTATVGKDGTIHLQCSDPSHDHGPGKALKKAEANDER